MIPENCPGNDKKRLLAILRNSCSGIWIKVKNADNTFDINTVCNECSLWRYIENDGVLIIPTCRRAWANLLPADQVEPIILE